MRGEESNTRFKANFKWGKLPNHNEAIYSQFLPIFWALVAI